MPGCVRWRPSPARRLRRPIMVAAAAAGAALALLKRRRGQADTALWREATSDSSR